MLAHVCVFFCDLIVLFNSISIFMGYLVVFYGISTIFTYLMLNPVFTYIKYVICTHILNICKVKRSNSSFSNNSISQQR